MTIEADVRHTLKRLSDVGLLNLNDMVGCTDAEIAEIMAAQGVTRLPEWYRIFLTICGRKSWPLFQGSDGSYEDLLRMKQIFLDEIRAPYNPEFDPPNDAFVFFYDAAGSFDYFLTDDTPDDPPVYAFDEAKGQTRSWPSITAYFEMRIEERRRNNKLRK